MGLKDLSSSKHGLLCAALLGFGQLCMYTGYDSQSFIVESAMHSVSERDPGRMNAHSGYRGQAIMYCLFTISNFFAPWIMQKIGSRMTLVIGSLMFTLYFVSFFYLHFVPFYITSALMGVGFAMFYMGEGGYLTEHSTKRTIDRNSALSWAIGTVCMIIGGIVLLLTLKPAAAVVVAAAAADETNTTAATAPTTAAPVGGHGVTQDFSDKQIRIMYGAFAGIALISNVVFFFLPSKIDPRSLAATGNQEQSFLTQLKSTLFTLLNGYMLMLAPFFSLLGSQGSFWMSVFPTTLTFSSHLSHNIQLPAFYSISCGIGATLMGLAISCLSRKFDNFGQKPTMIIGCITHLIALVLVYLSTPAEANRGRSTDHSLPVSPNVPIALLIAFLLGCADSCFNTVRTVICALVLPQKRTEAFSISKFYQSLTGCILLFVANRMTIPVFTIVLACKCLIGAALYFVVVSRARTGDAEATRTTRTAAAARCTLPFLTRLGIRPADSTATAGTTA
ncbi:hypothetical protein PFISCL1PPCAC_25052 [Pristionchus fissidentatus]|uniref:Membrane transporter n=1 Tax=Pristionchus fissidentatus TaxID=1538716 RepID=A0AAV5WQ47_9BILA|nr:hypothetical protein PFISCL1PPCAC_25052 [Pristionchus fissidentatus]